MIRTAAEWQSVLERVAPFASPDPESDLHRIGLKVVDGRLRWMATDSYRMAVLDAGVVDLPDCDIRLSPIQVAFAAARAGTGAPVTVEVDDDLDIPLVEADGLSCGMTVGRDGWPDIDEVLAKRTAPGPCANVRVSTTALRGVLSAISYATKGADAPFRYQRGRRRAAHRRDGRGQWCLSVRARVRD